MDMSFYIEFCCPYMITPGFCHRLPSKEEGFFFFHLLPASRHRVQCLCLSLERGAEKQREGKNGKCFTTFSLPMLGVAYGGEAGKKDNAYLKVVLASS